MGCDVMADGPRRMCRRGRTYWRVCVDEGFGDRSGDAEWDDLNQIES